MPGGGEPAGVCPQGEQATFRASSASPYDREAKASDFYEGLLAAHDEKYDPGQDNNRLRALV